MTNAVPNASKLQSSLSLLHAPEPWHAGVIRIDQFPASATDREMLRDLASRIAKNLATTGSLHHTAFVQSWRLSPSSGSEIISAQRSTLQPKLGLGIWPDREGPRSWSEELLQDAAAAAMQGEEPELPYYQVLRLTAEHQARPEGLSHLRGMGLLIDLFHSDPFEMIEQRTREAFTSKLIEDKHRRSAFLCPLLSAHSLATAVNAAELDSWIGGSALYLRESAEDCGLLLLSHRPIDELLTAAQDSVRPHDPR